MRDTYIVTMALLVTAALVGGVAGPVAGAQPTTEAPPTASAADGGSVHQADGAAACEFPV